MTCKHIILDKKLRYAFFNTFSIENYVRYEYLYKNNLFLII